MTEILHNCLPTIILPIISIIISIIALIKNSKINAFELEYKTSVYKFEVQKELLRQHERKIDEMSIHLNSRSHLIPWFHLILDDSKIEKIFDNTKIKLGIGLINIGKESATNVMIEPMDNGWENYFETVNEEKNSYFLYEYLSKYYAMPRESIYFSMIKDIPKDNDGIVCNYIKFKIRFKDLLGNLYEQNFEFGYDNAYVRGYSLKNFSTTPILIEN